MSAKKTGQQTAVLTSPLTILCAGNVVGRMEGEGPLAACFDYVDQDDTFGEATWEQSERAMQQKALALALQKGGLTARQLDMDLAHALAHYLHLDQVTLILCGGQDQIAAQREQWNDGSNTLCIRPGVVIAYDRNYITNEILESYGITVLKIPSGELSRGRGGPRCMSMPLIRDVKF